MHKTASTTIQNRLKANQTRLRDFGYRYFAKERKALVKAAQNKDFKPWSELILKAKAQNLTPIVSHEAFSHVLCRPGSAKNSRRIGEWLLEKLSQASVNVTMICFVRDQASYLNSHYTQHVKRFATAQSLEDYAAKAMQPSIWKSSCDPEQLFGWLEHHPSVRAVFFPYGRSITPPPSLANSPREPFEQLIQCLGIPESVHFQPVANRNTQPGDLTVRTALLLHQELKRDGIRLGKAAQRARSLLSHEAEQRNWMRTPYMGLDSELNQRIRAYFAAANNRFAQRVWGCQWDQIFTTVQSEKPRNLTIAEQDEIARAIRRIRRKLFPLRKFPLRGIRNTLRNILDLSRTN